jgi:hypothetical protein
MHMALCPYEEPNSDDSELGKGGGEKHGAPHPPTNGATLCVAIRQPRLPGRPEFLRHLGGCSQFNRDSLVPGSARDSGGLLLHSEGLLEARSIILAH